MPTIITQGAASAKGFGFGNSGVPERDWSDYVIIPINRSARTYPDSLAFYNVATGTGDYIINLVGPMYGGVRVVRLGNLVLVSNTSNRTYVYDIQTGVNTQNFYGNVISTGQTGDVIKISKTEVAFVYKNSLDIWFSIWKSNGTTLSNTVNANVSGFWADTQTGYGAPAACSLVTLTAKAQFDSYTGFVDVIGVDYYTVATGTKWGTIALSTSGSASVVNSGTSTNNFSRPGAATGTDNYGYVQYFDNSYAAVTYSNGAFTPSGASGVGWSGQWAPAGMHNTGGFFVGNDYDGSGNLLFRRYTPSATTILSVTQSTWQGGMQQMYTNGAYLMYTDSAGTTSYIRFYSSGLVLGSPIVLPATVTGGGAHFINFQLGCARVYNF